MTNFRAIFENDWCGIDNFLKEVLSPVFGEYEQGYDVLTRDSEVREKAKIANITEIRHAATFEFFGIELKVFDITVGDNKKLENNKVGIQSIVRQYINQFEGGLIIFHHQNVENKEWRFSYVEKRVSARDSTSAKRYTYLLGKGHPARTIAERFKELESKKDKDESILLPALTNAFSVAPLSDDFFNEYREHYADLVEYISGKRFVKESGKFVEEQKKNPNEAFKSAFDGDDKSVRDYVKKMMGRLVFLHFLQKKGWLGVPENGKWGSGDKNFIYNLFKYANDNIKEDFLEQALEPLFFKTLNIDRGEDAIAPKAVCDIYGSKIRIPYLNGGLFEEDELDKKQVKFKKEDFEELLEFFNQYNFTIDETDPDDQEIGVDPEMLGKIFENLLEDNKDKGAFYTPKEIVQYMCRESLIAYLEEKTKIDARDFVINHVVSFSDSQKADVLKALLDVKICDPAVGSGAFPMGMMNELLACTQLLTGDSKSRSWLKKHIVKNNIYGVDIEKGAVDIARLRFWLAIIVDEEKPQPLPNLDYKIMQGNSLLECYEGIDLSNIAKEEIISGEGINLLGEYIVPDDEWKEMKNAQLSGFKHDLSVYYDISEHEKKEKLQKDIMDFVKDRIIDKLDYETKSIRKRSVELDTKAATIHSQLESFSPSSKDPTAIKLRKEQDKVTNERLRIKDVIECNEQKQRKVLELAFNNTEFFLWHTWFGEVFNRPNDCNGFDVVIGNPPYVFVRDAHFTDTFKKDINNIYFSKLTSGKKSKANQAGKINLFALFILQGIFLMKNKGILSFIIPNNILRTTTYDLVRKYLLDNTSLNQIVDLGSGIFEKVTASTITLMLTKNLKSDNHVSAITDVKDLMKEQWICNKIPQKQFNDNTSYAFNIFGDETNNAITRVIEKNTTPFGDYCIDMIEGIVAKKSLIFNEPGKNRYPMLEGKCIKKFVVSGINKYIEWNVEEIHRTRPDYLWEQNEKLVTQRISGGSHPIVVSYDTKKYKAFASTNNIVLKDEYRHLYKYFLALLNSNVLNWYYANNFSNNSTLTVNISKTYLEQLPIPNSTEDKKKEIITLVEKILSAKEENPQADTTTLESEIDNLVYKLYGLNAEEINIIEK